MIFDLSKVIFPNNLFSNILSNFFAVNYKDYFVSLEFFNDNCVFVSSNATYFLVINKMTTIMLMFTDNEGDSITFKSYNNDLISNYNRATNNTEQYQMILQANEARNDPSTMLFNYTDFYHKDASFVQNITLEFYLFFFWPTII